ncbi:type IV pilus modification PilV family protein [Legionella jamestowniensis]|uniref:Tfp pilus assembly protein PilV n=1 Tax=Legionella jamestowniensis TaxID=455 RepID=A0A0W0UGI5_9GAMM|nr:prepilin-type N-terminal cleavage/methylation domain-containing protein [Legionella jamestowniensis]KTD06993.1 hypothetical protein Ljam_1188 [Legionella jamestowniensis]OCH96775.1 hypothetical protein A8135_06360 [Legionella jamestowniensis]SFM04062.1 prepilin peptidase dependent protein C [Legionella jamestowniensis DSM 19215]
MENSQGFSLTELLITLVLVTSISLTLLHQNAQINQMLRYALQRSFAIRLLDNNAERVLQGLPLTEIPQPFTLKMISIPQGKILQLTWGFKLPGRGCCQLQRKLFHS